MTPPARRPGRAVALGLAASLAVAATMAPSAALAERTVGGPSADTLRGGASADVLVGLDGRDRLFGGGGPDRIFGGGDGDLLVGGAGGDALHANAGGDRALGGAGNDTLAGGDGHDELAGGPGADRLLGGSHGDVLGGGPGADRLGGGGGPDVIVGGPGPDVLLGGAGRDVVRALDGRTDTVACGIGRDRVLADVADEVAASCEDVTRHSSTAEAEGPVETASEVRRTMRMAAAAAPEAEREIAIAWGHEQGVATTVCLRVDGPAGADASVRFTDALGEATGSGPIGEEGSLLASIVIEAELPDGDPEDPEDDPEPEPFSGPVGAEVTVTDGRTSRTLVDRYDVVGARGGIDCAEDDGLEG